MNRRRFLTTAVLLVPLASLQAHAATPLRLVKDPNCTCCEGHADYLRANGYGVVIEEAVDLNALRQELGIPDHLVGCHTIFAEDYVIEGHVPAGAIAKLLRERPPIKGIALPGMPEGSPGMGGTKAAPLVVYEIADKEPIIFFTE